MDSVSTRVCESTEDSAPPTKVRKLEEKYTNSELEPESKVVQNGTIVTSEANSQALPPLNEFTIDQVLSEDVKSKSIVISGHFGSTTTENSAVIIAEKTQPTLADLEKLFGSEKSKFITNTSNNIYAQIEASCGDGCLGNVRLLTVYPATEAHIAKYSQQIRHVIHETPKDYAEITRPFIKSQSFDIQWVYNILEGKKEQDRVIYNDPDPETGFVLLPDFKWDQKEVQNLYVLAICRKKGILSLRELGREHLSLLKNIQEKGKEAIKQRYGIPGDQLRVYVHYQPSYYHLHVHFTQLSYAAPKSSVGDAHLLSDIISNIETIDGEFYQKCSLSFTIKESSLLWRAYRQHSSLI